jgi:peroxiredoxin
MPRLQAGDRAPAHTKESLQGVQTPVPHPDHPFTHLQFRRFAGCPICNLHLRSIVKRLPELKANGIFEVAVFHSERETMLPYQGDLPFSVIADPARTLYDAYGVGAGVASVLNPRAWGALMRGMLASHPKSPFTGEGGHTGLPADFLIDSSGVIRAVRYGAHANDHWSVDELVALAAGSTEPTVAAPPAP